MTNQTKGKFEADSSNGSAEREPGKTGSDSTTIASCKANARQPNRRPRRMAREPKAGTASTDSPAIGSAMPVATTSTPAEPRQTKSAAVLALLQRIEGATLDQLVEATGWLPHTARAVLTGLKKKGHTITSSKEEGQPRIYRAGQA